MERFFQLIEAPLVWLSQQFSPAARITSVKPTGSEIGVSLQDCSYGQPVSISPKTLEKHAYLLGSTGSGKTNLILKLIEQDIRRNHSLVVLDLRGDLVERVLALCQAKDVHTGRLILLDLREKERIVGFNPLSGEGEPFIKALHLLDVIRSESDSWGVQLEETLRNCLMLLSETDGPVTWVEQLLFDTRSTSNLLSHSQDPSVRSFFSHYQQLSEEKQLAWALPVLNKLTPLFPTQRLRATYGSDQSINLKGMLDSPGSIILVSLAVDELHRAGRMLGALLVSAIARTMMARVNIPEAQRNPVRLYVDEAENFASEAFEGLIAEGRRFKLSLVLSHQNLSQLPPKLRSVIRNNVGLQCLFTCGYEDAKHLAGELPEGFDQETLLQLAPGELFLLPRRGEAQHLRCQLSHIPIDAQALADYRQDILRETGLPLTEVEAYLQSLRRHSPTIESIQRPWGMEEPS